MPVASVDQRRANFSNQTSAPTHPKTSINAINSDLRFTRRELDAAQHWSLESCASSSQAVTCDITSISSCEDHRRTATVRGKEG